MNLLAIESLLRLQSSEASLLCQRGHVAGHPDYCPDGCRLMTSDGTVGGVLPHKDTARIEALAQHGEPFACVWIEDGWLVDGHHRVAAARLLGLTTMKAIEVSGVIEQQRRYHAEMQNRLFVWCLSGCRVYCHHEPNAHHRTDVRGNA